MAEKTDNKSTTESNSRTAAGILQSAIPAIVFAVVILVFGLLWNQSVQQQKSHAAERQRVNQALGLPTDFPSDVIPVYQGVEILETDRGSAKSMDGEPMDKWYVHGQIDSERKPILDFYNDLLLNSGMGQTQFISVPALDGSGPNYAVSYADENYLAEFYIEKLSKDVMTQYKLTVYRIRK